MNDFFKNLPEDHPAKKIRYRKVDKNGVYNDDGNLNWPGGGGPRYDVVHPITHKPCKVPASGWRIANPEVMQALIDADKIAFKSDHNGIPRMKTYLHEMESEVATSVIRRMGQRAVETVTNILGKTHSIIPKIMKCWQNSSTLLLGEIPMQLFSILMQEVELLVMLF